MPARLDAVERRLCVSEDVALGGDLTQIEPTEDGVAKEFAARFRDRIRFDHDVRAWFIWHEDHWVQDKTKKAFEWARQLSREASEALPHAASKSVRKAGFAYGVERFAQSDPSLAGTREFWDQDAFLLGVPGGTLNLKTGEILEPHPSDGITKRAAVAPGEGDPTKWLDFLSTVSGGDEDVVHFIQIWCGYLLTGETSEQTLLFLYGPGGNGKSLFLNIVSRVLGDYAVQANMDTFTASRLDRHPTDLAMLAGARMVSASETTEGRSWDEGRIKSLTGGDPITARYMRKDFFTYLPSFKLTFVGNNQPVLRNVDQAMRRRILMLAFNHQPEKPDPELEKKIWAEAPQILKWMIRGCLEWLERGLPRPSAITSLTEQYFEDQDTFGEWLANHCRVDDRAGQTSSADLFSSWKEYAEAHGEQPGSAKALGQRLRRRGLQNGDARIDGKVRKVWFGIALLDRIG
ncbi:phage/plasmid primase, P4 family [Marimonas lutisalis]|uniref:phage/plasmid primase, P4 family n=1 Tax=Marimonas lutisalis TaxID=2545756 RepID=UPI0010F630AF|nr:phage/plasmid primase, P4 family [Marimonas lutisalis]